MTSQPKIVRPQVVLWVDRRNQKVMRRFTFTLDQVPEEYRNSRQDPKVESRRQQRGILLPRLLGKGNEVENNAEQDVIGKSEVPNSEMAGGVTR